MTGNRPTGLTLRRRPLCFSSIRISRIYQVFCTYPLSDYGVRMAKLTIIFGVLLAVLAVVGFVSTGSEHPTALIPAALGLLFVLFGVMANPTDPKKRMLWMHISVTIALLAFLGTIPAGIDSIR